MSPKLSKAWQPAISSVVQSSKKSLKGIDNFKSLKSFRNALKKVQYTGDLMIDSAQNFLFYAQWLIKRSEVAVTTDDFPNGERQKPVILAKNLERSRTAVHKKEKGLKLRFIIKGQNWKQW